MNRQAIAKVNIKKDDPVYVISVVSRIVHIPVWTLRQLEKAGVVKPKRVGPKTRLYSLIDIEKLEHIRYLMATKRVNIHGIKVILEVE